MTTTGLEKFIRGKWFEYVAGAPERRKADFKITIPFEDWEAKFFMQGIAQNFFTVIALCDCLFKKGRAKLPECHLHASTLEDPTCKNFFYPGSPENGREAVTQFAAITRLIEEYGYPPANVLPESKGFQNSIHRFALDGLVFDGPRPAPNRQESVLIAMEAKTTKKAASNLVANIEGCVRRGEHPIEVHGEGSPEWDAHQKYRGIIAWRPLYFWVVSPKEQDWFAYSVRQVSTTGFLLEVVNDIPKFMPRPARPVKVVKRADIQ